VSLGIATAIAVSLHRVGLLLVPAFLVAWIVAVRRHGGSPRAWPGLALPLAAVALVARPVLGVVLGVDLPQHVAHRVGGPERWLDHLNALLITAPLAPLAPVLGVACARVLPRRAAAWPALATGIVFTVLAVVVEPQQGFVRDWDMFAPAGMAIAVIAAWLAGEVVSGLAAKRPVANAGGVAIAVVLAAAVPSLQWLVHLHDATLGLGRAHAVVVEPPRRSELERGRLLDFIGIRRAWLGDWNAAADAFAESAALLPTPRVLDQWSKAEIQSGDWDRALEAARLWTSRVPDDLEAWRTMAAVTTHRNDRQGARLAAERILELNPGDVDAKGILEYLDLTETRSSGR
jgi:hypothetical protein